MSKNKWNNSGAIAGAIGGGVGNAIYQVMTHKPSYDGQRELTTRERVASQDPVVILSVIGALIVSVIGLCAIALLNIKPIETKKNKSNPDPPDTPPQPTWGNPAPLPPYNPNKNKSFRLPNSNLQQPQQRTEVYTSPPPREKKDRDTDRYL